MGNDIQRCSFSPGDTIAGSYRIERVLGEGSYGVVYAVSDRQGQPHALKLLRLWEVHPELRKGLLWHFDMEYETGLISSPYLVHSTDHGLVMGNPYIVMELCTGGDLMSNIERHDVDLKTVAMHVLQGLKALHVNGKVHRDLKPENVLLKSNGMYALTDFGISGDRNKHMTECNILGKPKQIFGTYAYMPPEQVNPRRDATVLPTTDIFSFGVMMYQLLTGVLPFGPLEDEGDLPSYLRKGRKGQWDSDTLLKQADGQQWLQMIDGCLKPDFKTRLQNVDECIRLCPQPKKSNVDRTLPVCDADVPDFETRITKGVLLRVMQGEDHGEVFKLDDMLDASGKAMLTMGRVDNGVQNDIGLHETNSSYISRRHCTLELDYGTGLWVVRDGQWSPYESSGWRASTNGTYVNSKETTPAGAPFSPGDIISLGEVKLRAEGY